jgi:hypothetical protein
MLNPSSRRAPAPSTPLDPVPVPLGTLSPPGAFPPRQTAASGRLATGARAPRRGAGGGSVVLGPTGGHVASAVVRSRRCDDWSVVFAANGAGPRAVGARRTHPDVASPGIPPTGLVGLSVIDEIVRVAPTARPVIPPERVADARPSPGRVPSGEVRPARTV